jgi:hypothetical protein
MAKIWTYNRKNLAEFRTKNLIHDRLRVDEPYEIEKKKKCVGRGEGGGVGGWGPGTICNAWVRWDWNNFVAISTE